jgi:hypothetical protein
MFVYLEAYQQSEEPANPLVAYVTFFRDGRKWLETKPVEVKTAGDERVATMRFPFSARLNGLSPGQYECQVSILKFEGEQGAFWQAPVMVVP